MCLVNYQSSNKLKMKNNLIISNLKLILYTSIIQFKSFRQANAMYRLLGDIVMWLVVYYNIWIFQKKNHYNSRKELTISLLKRLMMVFNQNKLIKLYLLSKQQIISLQVSNWSYATTYWLVLVIYLFTLKHLNFNIKNNNIPINLVN